MKKSQPFSRDFFGALSGTLPGCAVSHRCGDFRRLHYSAALPNAPLRFLRHWRRSAPHTRGPLIKSQLLYHLLRPHLAQGSYSAVFTWN